LIVELAPLSDPPWSRSSRLSIGIEMSGSVASTERVANALRLKQLLLVLDNCEHGRRRSTNAEALLRANPDVRVITTSRDPLRVDGEWIFPIPPLAVPTELGRDNDDLVQYGAVRLFIARARAGVPHFSPDERTVAAIVAICRRLDGIPLAIELAAARAASLDIEELASGSIIVLTCSPLAGARPFRSNGHYGRHSIGATTCSPRLSNRF
jgi:predicted ATPase